MKKKRIIIATHNFFKFSEISKMLSPLGYECISLRDLGYNNDIIEDKDTFEDNALIKAKTIYDYYKSSVISDDSGLIVDVLINLPGVHSHRFAKEDANDKENRDYLISILKKYGPGPFKAHFETSIIYMDRDKVIKAKGRLDGEIILEERGNNGFGYDPIFYLKDKAKTLAELSQDEKNELSHRHMAIMNLIEELQK